MRTPTRCYEGFRHIMDPYWYGEAEQGETPEAFGLRAARALEDEILAVGPENVAAFAAEPVQGAGGVKIAPSTYWPEVQRIVDKYGILLLADEVITGFGRLGTWFASQHYGIQAEHHHLRQGRDLRLPPALRHHRRRQDRRCADGP